MPTCILLWRTSVRRTSVSWDRSSCGRVVITGVAGYRSAIRQIDPYWGHFALRPWWLDKSRSARQQVRKQPHAFRARHLACFSIDERVGTVTQDPSFCCRHLLELFAFHGLDREPPEFCHGTNDRYQSFLLSRQPDSISLAQSTKFSEDNSQNSSPHFRCALLTQWGHRDVGRYLAVRIAVT